MFQAVNYDVFLIININFLKILADRLNNRVGFALVPGLLEENCESLTELMKALNSTNKPVSGDDLPKKLQAFLI